MKQSREPNHLIQILLVDSVKDLFKYKSFFLLIFVLMLFDRILKRFVKVDRSFIQTSELKQLTHESAQYVFQQLPLDLFNALTDYRTFLILAILFLLKQIISLWPSSDMRRMHRSERGTFGLLGSLAVIRWEQVLWDAIAVGTVCGLYAFWAGAGFGLLWFWWQTTQAIFLLPLLLLHIALFAPMAMAGFSFSSKLAVLSKGSFAEKLRLYFQLFISGKVLWSSWLFFGLRILVELIFVVVIPLIVLLVIDIFWIRVPLATLIATPVYSYLKMASFKFFLEIYGQFPLVREEFSEYYFKP